MPVFPGTEPPVLREADTIARNGYAELKITLMSHTGTHLDAPAHMLPQGRTLDSYPITEFHGRAVLADFSRGAGYRIGVEDLTLYENRLRQSRFLILRTGWAERWGREDYFRDFPALTPSAARWIIGLGIKGVGVDTLSVDRIEDRDFPVHHCLFESGLFVMENLNNLAQVGTDFILACFPLRIKNADGAPVRAVAFVER